MRILILQKRYFKLILLKKNCNYSKNHMRFKNKFVLITGASRGIGKAAAILFAKEGAKIVVNYFSSENEARKAVDEIKRIGSEAIAIKCDVSKENEVEAMINKAIEVFGKIDILVNNAGIVYDAPIFKKTSKQWKRTMEVNLFGTYLCSKYGSAHMLKNNCGKIINISSTSAIYSFYPEIIDYDASKAGVIALTKDFAKALAPRIQVNAIAPGWVNTEINKDLSKSFIKKETRQIYLKRFAKPEEIANVILFLASEDSSFITGSVLVVDGGHD
jgi:3-oxoacyl-[acyl-carrier protein] reductase